MQGENSTAGRSRSILRLPSKLIKIPYFVSYRIQINCKLTLGKFCMRKRKWICLPSNQNVIFWQIHNSTERPSLSFITAQLAEIETETTRRRLRFLISIQRVLIFRRVRSTEKAHMLHVSGPEKTKSVRSWRPSGLKNCRLA